MKNIFCPGINFNSIIVAPPSCRLYLLGALAFTLQQLLFISFSTSSKMMQEKIMTMLHFISLYIEPRTYRYRLNKYFQRDDVEI